MKAATINEIKKELESHTSQELVSYCLRLAKFKKESKELLSFMLFEAHDLAAWINQVKKEIEEQFLGINRSNIYFIKKSVRKILRYTMKQIRFAGTELAAAELLIHFCNCIGTFSIPVNESRQLLNLYNNQLKKIEKGLSGLHPDLQYDLRRQVIFYK